MLMCIENTTEDSFRSSVFILLFKTKQQQKTSPKDSLTHQYHVMDLVVLTWQTAVINLLCVIFFASL